MNNQQEQFINPNLNYRHMDNYYQRLSILQALNDILPELHGKILDAGCGEMPYRDHIMDNSKAVEYTGLEYAGTFSKSGTPDAFWDGTTMPFDDDSFDCAICTEVLEHLFQPEILLKENNRVLKPGGFLFITTPFVWNLHEQPFDYYRYTPNSLQKLLLESGFEHIHISALGGWHASLAQMLGLWVRRSGLNTFKRRIMSIILLPVIRFLIKKDNRQIDLSGKNMYTGLMATARKK